MPTQWIDPIYDRTQADVDRVKELKDIGYFNMTNAEKTEWASDLKGALNRSDLERIENNIQILSDVLDLNLTTYAGNVPEIPDVTYYKNLHDNAHAIYEVGYVRTTTPDAPDNPYNRFDKINDIEKLLYDVHYILEQTFYYWCSTPAQVYAGETIGLLL